MKRTAKRILAVMLAFLMVNSVVDYSGVITVNAQTLPVGAEEEDIRFPEKLKMTHVSENGGYFQIK